MIDRRLAVEASERIEIALVECLHPGLNQLAWSHRASSACLWVAPQAGAGVAHSSFLCLSGVVDFLVLLHQFEEFLVYAPVLAELGMEGRSHQLALANQHRMSIAFGQHLNLGPGALDARRANIDLLQRAARESGRAF